MVRNLSEMVIMPIAGIPLTFIACYELIQLIISYNNLANEMQEIIESVEETDKRVFKFPTSQVKLRGKKEFLL